MSSPRTATDRPNRLEQKSPGTPAKRTTTGHAPAITSESLTRAAGVAAMAAGALFVAVQVKHPHVDITLATTTQWKIRELMKVGVALLGLAGITGMYLRQLRQMRLLGLVGYLVFASGLLLMFAVELIGLTIVPTVVNSAPRYVADILAVANGGTANGDIGLFTPLNLLFAFGHLAGGVLFGVALFRARVLARWAAALLAIGSGSSLLIPLLPQVNQRLFAVPTGIALIGLGYSLWRLKASATAGAR